MDTSRPSGFTTTDGDDEDPSFFETSLPTEFSDVHEESDLDCMANLDNSNSKLPKSNIIDLKRTFSDNLSKLNIEKKQIMHDLQLHKIELSQKALLIDNLKADHMNRSEDLEERLHESEHQRKMLAAKLDSLQQLNQSNQEESKRRHDRMRSDLQEILRRQQELESTNARLQGKACDLRRQLEQEDLGITEEEYYEFKGLSDDSLTLRQFVGMKMFEAISPLRTEARQLRDRAKLAEQANHSLTSKVQDLEENYERERKEHADVLVRYQKVVTELGEARKGIQMGDYKTENFDKLKQEKDLLESEHIELQKRHTYLDASYNALINEREQLNGELTDRKQTITLLHQDKDYLTSQVNKFKGELTQREERLLTAVQELEEMKRSKEEMYEKYVVAREQHKCEYEQKLRDELEGLRIKSEREMNRLQNSSREMFERENRQLRDARDVALAEREQALSAERETSMRLNSALQDVRNVQLECDARILDVQSEVKLKLFEAERTLLVHEETCQTLKTCQMENEKLVKKNEILTKEFYAAQSSSNKRICDIEAQLADKKTRLEVYEKMENELDEIVMQAAALDNEQVAEKVLFAYGHGANIPTTAKRRLQHSAELARRVLTLERQNTSMLKEEERLKREMELLQKELSDCKKLLDQTKQPYQYLVEGVRTRDYQARLDQEQIKKLEAEVDKASNDRSEYVKEKNRMQLDIERLLSHREEMSVMRQLLNNLITERKMDPADIHTLKKVVITDSSYPQPITITKEDTPRWYQKLKLCKEDLT